MNKFSALRSVVWRGMSKSTPCSCPSPTSTGCPLIDSEKKPSSSGHRPGGYKLYMRLYFFVCVPMILMVAFNTYLGMVEEHAKPRPDHVAYSYLCMRNKRFPWGDGTKSLYHNPKKNALPNGYEEDEHDEQDEQHEE